MIADPIDEMLEQSRAQPLVMGIALHPYIVGQPHRLRPLRQVLTTIARARDAGQIWLSTPGPICDHAAAMEAGQRALPPAQHSPTSTICNPKDPQ